MAANADVGERPPPPTEPENLPCPRCDSTSTKFCYYNNYNLSQPRYFCKSCRRFWTRGGTLRNLPIGGGTRKKSKRSRSSSSAASTAVTPPLPLPTPAVVINTMPFENEAVVETEMLSPLRNDDVDFDLNGECNFTSLLTTSETVVNGGETTFVGLPWYGLGFGLESGLSGHEEIGLGFGEYMTDENQVVGQTEGSNTWQFGSGDVVDGPDCFG